MNKALLIIDVQNDYFPGGRAELHGPLAALANIEKALGAFRAQGLPVVHVQHLNTRAGAGFFLPGTAGAQIHQNLAPLAGEALVVKHVPSSFLGTGLAGILAEKGAGELVVCGMMTHMCVDTTVRACMDHGLAVTLLADACATKDLVFNGVKIPAETVQSTYMASLDGLFARVIETAALRV